MAVYKENPLKSVATRLSGLRGLWGRQASFSLLSGDPPTVQLYKLLSLVDECFMQHRTAGTKSKDPL